MKCQYIQLIGEELVGNIGVFDFDRSKLIFSTKNCGLTGKELYNCLLEKYHIQMEMEADSYALAIASVGDTEEGFERLCNAIEEIDRQQETSKTEKTDVIKENSPNMHMKLVDKLYL